MNTHYMNRLMQEADEFDSEGLDSRLEKFLGGSLDGIDPSENVTSEPERKSSLDVNADLNDDDDDDDDPENAPTPELEEEEEFPTLGKGEKADPVDEKDAAFDESKFNAETEEEVKGMDKKAGEKWKLLKNELRDLKKKDGQAAVNGPETERELADLREKVAEVEALRKRNGELLKVNDRILVEESDEYISQVRKPLADMEEVLIGIAELAKIEPKDVFSIVTESSIAAQDAMLEKLEGVVSPRAANRISMMAEDYRKINSLKREMLSDAQKTLEQSKISGARRLEEDITRKANAFKESSKEAFRKYASRVPSFTDSSGNLTEIAKSIMDKTSTIDPSTLDSSDLGYMSFCTNAFPEARKAIVKLQKEVQMLKIAKGGQSRGIEGSPHSPAPEGINPEAGLSERMKGIDFTFKQ